MQQKASGPAAERDRVLRLCSATLRPQPCRGPVPSPHSPGPSGAGPMGGGPEARSKAHGGGRGTNTSRSAPAGADQRLGSGIDLQEGRRALGFPGSWYPQPVTPSYCQGNYLICFRGVCPERGPAQHGPWKQTPHSPQQALEATSMEQRLRRC